MSGSGFSQGLRAAGAVLSYIESTHISEAGHIKRLALYRPSDYMILDEATVANLELLRAITGSRRGSLLSVLDKSASAMGGRMIMDWLVHPLIDPEKIIGRLSAVEELVEMGLIRERLRDSFSRVHDLERLMGRISTGMASPRDMMALCRSLELVPGISALLSSFAAPLLRSAAESLSDPGPAAGWIAEALVEEPPVKLADGGYIRPGYSRELDELNAIATQGKDWIARLEASEKQRTGITSLKIRYNRVFGYYIEVTRPNLDKVPEDYLRKQTLAGSERFVTPSLKEQEEKVLSAQESRLELELKLFEELRSKVSLEAAVVQRIAQGLAQLDALSTLAEVAERNRYVRPVVDNSEYLEITEGRHPVIEEMPLSEGFVPNDTFLDHKRNQLLIVTGPNMAGKSTVLRQTALIALMAQMGSFVPASRARIGVLDRIFTRVGARDHLHLGQSTFMVEMIETSNILHHATPRSLIILDEIGRGTSTFDGVSIAWAVAEYIHDRIKAKTLFATHYHELTQLSETKEGVANFNIAVKEWEEEVIFLRQLVPGGTNRSYGIQVGRLAGLPGEVVERAKEILAILEDATVDEIGAPILARAGDSQQLSLFHPQPAPKGSAIEEELRKLATDSLTPLEALNLLYEWKKRVEQQS